MVDHLANFEANVGKDGAVVCAKRYNPADMGTWPFYPIAMPLNKEGQGPAPMDEIAVLTWEVWDIFFNVVGSHNCLPDAINQAQQLNAAISLKHGGKDG